MNCVRLIFALLLLNTTVVFAQNSTDDLRGLNGLHEVKLSELTDSNISPLGKQALSIEPDQWKHAETKNFVYHFFHGFVATPVSVEAEFYYRVISKELGKDTTQWERKSHIYIFEKPEDWAEFQKKAALEPWTGGIHSGGDLFIQRNPEYKFKGRTLGHETTHLVIYRFFGNGVPLWLNEGYAEYASIKGFAAYNRARGYDAKPTSQVVDAASYIPVASLTSMQEYPTDVKQVAVFYVESERLVRFLSAEGPDKFAVFMEAMSHGNKFDTALSKAYGSRFFDTAALEQEFKTYATKPNDAN